MAAETWDIVLHGASQFLQCHCRSWNAAWTAFRTVPLLLCFMVVQIVCMHACRSNACTQVCIASAVGLHIGGELNQQVAYRRRVMLRLIL